MLCGAGWAPAVQKHFSWSHYSVGTRIHSFAPAPCSVTSWEATFSVWGSSIIIWFRIPNLHTSNYNWFGCGGETVVSKGLTKRLIKWPNKVAKKVDKGKEEMYGGLVVDMKVLIICMGHTAERRKAWIREAQKKLEPRRLLEFSHQQIYLSVPW